jgi:hypothetical protein
MKVGSENTTQSLDIWFVVVLNFETLNYFKDSTEMIFSHFDSILDLTAIGGEVPFALSECAY